MKLVIPFLFAASPLLADVCPDAPDHTDRLAEIIVELNAAPDALSAAPFSQELWALWTDAPDDKAQELLDRGMRQREGYDFLGARDTLDQLVEYCPDYAEGYNQRAFASFLRRDFTAALFDLERAIEIMPNHVAAVSGKGLTLLGLGRNDEAQEALKAAIALNPWLSEGSLITEPPGEDI